MIGKSLEPHENSMDLGLSSLELLGAYFTSQIHDLNNQMAVLSNSELLLPNEKSISPEMLEFVRGLFSSIHRLSASCDQFNAVRKAHPVEIEKVSLQEAMDAITGAVSDCKGWRAHGNVAGKVLVFLNTNWLPTIISQLIAYMPAEGGNVEISLGELPLRQYKYPLRSNYTQVPTRALLVHFKGETSFVKSTYREEDFQIALELIRLQGAGISLVKSDSAQDFLLAFRLQSL